MLWTEPVWIVVNEIQLLNCFWAPIIMVHYSFPFLFDSGAPGIKIGENLFFWIKYFLTWVRQFPRSQSKLQNNMFNCLRASFYGFLGLRTMKPWRLLGLRPRPRSVHLLDTWVTRNPCKDPELRGPSPKIMCSKRNQNIYIPKFFAARFARRFFLCFPLYSWWISQNWTVRSENVANLTSTSSILVPSEAVKGHLVVF